MRILHIVHRSFPGTSGYAIRTREIVTKEMAVGLEPLVVSSPSQAPAGPLDSERSEMIEGVRYFRSCGRLLSPTTEVRDRSRARAVLRIAQNASLLRISLRLARQYRPSVIHAHSPFTCGLTGSLVSRLTGIPWVYEMRGIWEDSHVSRDTMTDNSIIYKAVRGLEGIALRQADLCLVISDPLREEVIRRGVGPEKIRIVPNGVDVQDFFPGPPPPDLRDKWNLNDRIVLGYIGSFFHFEGLDLLVTAMGRISREFPDARLLLVGEGEATAELQRLATLSGCSDKIIFVGRVPHSQVSDYYKLCDLMALPRRDTRLTRVVTPLKPLEIMAMAKPLVASDIGGHLDVVKDKINGLLFRADDEADLAGKCEAVIRDQNLRKDLGSRARLWVEENRDWRILIKQYVEIYESLIQDRRDLGVF
jgi:glycogen synthase